MTSLPLYRAADLRRIEAAAADQPLMQRAGYAAAKLAMMIGGDRGAAILVLAGPGNNGGDAFEVARLLRERFFDPYTVFLGNAKGLPPDAAAAYQRFVEAGGILFGIGLKREIVEPYAGLIHNVNALAIRDGCPLLALDCPSGLDADTGKLSGATILASHTITFIGGKPGLFTGDGPDHCGEVSVAPLDLDAQSIMPAAGRSVGRELFSAQLKARPHNCHKGSHGDAGILGGRRYAWAVAGSMSA